MYYSALRHHMSIVAAPRQMLALRRAKCLPVVRFMHSSTARTQEAAQSSASISSPPGLSDVAALRRKVQNSGAKSVPAPRSSAPSSRSNQHRNTDSNTQSNRSGQRMGSSSSSPESRNRNDTRRRQNSNTQRGGLAGAGGRSEGRIQVQRRDGRPQQQQQRQQRGGRSGRSANFSRNDFEVKRRTPAPTQDIFPVTDWQHSAYRYAQGFTRVPYQTPPVTIESLKNTLPFDAKAHKPLYEAEKALKLHYSSSGVSLGPFQAPTLISRPRTKKDDAPKAVRKTESGSIAEEKQEARAKLLQERFGGDYQRWESSELGRNSIKLDLTTVEGQAAEALSHNEDLGPSLKLWTAKTVKSILGRK